MSKEFICKGCDAKIIKNACVSVVPDSASVEIRGCLFQKGSAHDGAKWEELEKEPEIVFSHKSGSISGAISGSTTEIGDELLKGMKENPTDFFGDSHTVSRVAEFIHENSNNPDVLSALARLVLSGLLN